MEVAVLGLGRMGHAIAHRLIAGGHDLTVWNRTKGRADDLVRAGAGEADTPSQALGAVEVAISSLANDDAVRDLTLGSHRLLAGLESRLYVDASTISPGLSAELAKASPRFVAMPILGAPQAVEDGEATYLVGGEAGPIDDLRPVFASLGGQLKRFDRPEKASTAKLAVNLMLLTGIVTATEAVTVGRAGGLTDDQLTDLLGDSPMLAPGLKNRFQALVDGTGPTWWTTVLAAKDARLAAEAASADGKTLRLAPMVHDLYQEAADAGFEDNDIISIAQLYR